MRSTITAVFIRRPGAALLVTTACCLALWWVGFGFQTREGIDAVLDARPGQREVYERAAAAGPIERTLLIDVETDRIFSPESLALVGEITEAFLALPGVTAAKSLTHAVMPVRRGLSFAFEPLVPAEPWTPEALDELERFCLAHPLIRNVMVSADGRRSLILVEYAEERFAGQNAAGLRAEAIEILDTFATNEARFRLLAVPFAELEIREAVAGDVAIFAVGSLLLAVFVLRLAFLGWRLALSLLAGHLLYLSLLPGLFLAAGYRPEPFAVAVFPLLGAIQLALLAHLGTAAIRALPGSRNRSEALERAVGEVWKTCLFAALTTVVGLLALTVSATGSVRELGWWGAVGVATGFLFSFGPALSLLALGCGRGQRSPAAALRPRPRPYRAAAWRVARFSRRQARPLLLGTSALAALTLPGLFLLEPDVQVTSFLPRGSGVGEAAIIADRDYGGFQFAQLDFDSGKQGGISNRGFLAYLWEMHRRAEQIPEVTAAYSYPQVLTILNQVWRGGDVEALRLPEEEWLLRLFVTGLNAFNLPLVDALADEAGQRAFLVIRMPSLSSGRYLEVVEEIRREAELHAPAGVEVTAGGLVHQFLAGDREIVRAQVASGVAALGAVGLLLVALWRSFRLAATGLLVTALPVASVLGLAGYLGLKLNAITVMAGAIAIGIAVDGAVHFITSWSEATGRLGDSPAAVAEALHIKAPPILFTSVILIGAFLLVGFSSFLPVAQLGLIVAGGLALTLPVVLLVLPGFLSR